MQELTDIANRFAEARLQNGDGDLYLRRHRRGSLDTFKRNILLGAIGEMSEAMMQWNKYGFGPIPDFAVYPPSRKSYKLDLPGCHIKVGSMTALYGLTWTHQKEDQLCDGDMVLLDVLGNGVEHLARAPVSKLRPYFKEMIKSELRSNKNALYENDLRKAGIIDDAEEVVRISPRIWRGFFDAVYHAYPRTSA